MPEITLYEVTAWRDQVKERTFSRVTDRFAVDKNGRREALESDTTALLKTMDEAIAAKRAWIRSKIAAAESQLAAARQELVKFDKKLTS